jgi:RNA polymerase sigma-54 factor
MHMSFLPFPQRAGFTWQMTPQMQLALRLLKLPANELHAQVQQALEANVMLEPDAEFDATWVLDSGLPAAPPEPARPHDPAGTLQEHLAWQLQLAPLPNGPLAIGRALIDAINDDGYLPEKPGAIEERVSGEVRADAGVVESVLAIIQKFDPVGVAARSVSECMEIQLAQLDPGTPGLEAARKIARHHLELVSSQQFKDLRRLTGCDAGELDAALALVGNCDLKPGAAFRSPRSEYGVPDLFARRTPASWEVELNPAAVPRIRMNEKYAAMVTRSNDQMPLRIQLQQARWLVRGLEVRNGMLLGIARALVARHGDFLDREDESVRPMTLGDLADAVGMHAAIVSRVTSGKYLHTPRGVFEFRFFCAGPMAAAASLESTGTWLSRTRPLPSAG